MTHYVCTGGCSGISEQPSVCQAADCIKYHQPMTVCHCADGSHQEAFENPNNILAEEGTHEL